MIRQWNIDDVSDGKLYSDNDLVKIGCDDCRGCSKCCHGMGESIILDPLDIYRLKKALNMSFEELLVDRISLNMVDGVILPNLKLAGENEGCTFLNSSNRCTIHNIRPGICRLFPLGRIYDNHDYKYFLQVNECDKPNKTKVKVKKWIGMEDGTSYRKFVVDWHYFLLDCESKIKECSDENKAKNIIMYILSQFYQNFNVIEDMDFYEEFNLRLKKASSDL